MKKILYIFLFSCLYMYAAAQSNLSSNTKRALYLLEKNALKNAELKQQLPEHFQSNLPISIRKNKQYISALLQVEESINISTLQKLGVTVHTKAGNIWTVQMPVETLGVLAGINGIRSIDVGGKMKLLLDEVRKETSANKVHIGAHLKQNYLGEGVVIGVIDQGFDFTHPTFYDSATKKLRITRVWNQLYNEDEWGLGFSPPAGYTYGMELVNPGDIIKNIDTADYQHENNIFKVSDGSGETHGTFVAGIAAGSGWGTSSKYQGLAPKSEIVLVSINEPWSAANIIDGIQYIFNYAASIGKPAVINFSAGTHIGPHDGTSLLSQAFNHLTGKGRILVGAAGNDGSSPIHFSHLFTKRDTIFTLAGLDIGGGKFLTSPEDVIDIWGSLHSDFAAKVLVYKENILIGETEFVRASSNSVFMDTIASGKDTAFISLATEARNPNNKRPNIQVHLTSTRYSNSLSYHLSFTGRNTTIHAWSNSYGFVNTGASRYISGDDLYTIVDGQTAANIVSVGAYATRNKYTNIYGEEQNEEDVVQVGDIAPFSSKGPTLDSRTKPDITAPGFQVISSASSFTDYFGEGGFSANTVAYTLPSPVNGRNYLFAAESGTSFASPVAAGAIALMLDANPQLSPLQVQTILKATARKDLFTGRVPFTGSNIWGWGKVNVHSAVRGVELLEKVTFTPIQFIYPNVVTDHISVVLPDALKGKPCLYTILDQSGKPLLTNIASSDRFMVSVAHLPRGSYLIQLSDKTTSITNKFIKQ